MSNKKLQANAICKAILALDGLGAFGSSEDISAIRRELYQLMVARGYTFADAGSTRTRALTKDDGKEWKDHLSAKNLEK